MSLEKILEFAKDHGYASVKKMKPWRGYDVYEPIFDDENDISFVGEPLLILVKDENKIMSTVEEDFRQID